MNTGKLFPLAVAALCLAGCFGGGGDADYQLPADFSLDGRALYVADLSGL